MNFIWPKAISKPGIIMLTRGHWPLYTGMYTSRYKQGPETECLNRAHIQKAWDTHTNARPQHTWADIHSHMYAHSLLRVDMSKTNTGTPRDTQTRSVNKIQTERDTGQAHTQRNTNLKRVPECTYWPMQYITYPHTRTETHACTPGGGHSHTPKHTMHTADWWLI